MILSLADDGFKKLPEKALHDICRLAKNLPDLKLEAELLLTEEERKKYPDEPPLDPEKLTIKDVVSSVLKSLELDYEKLEAGLLKYKTYINNYHTSTRTLPVFGYTEKTSLEMILRNILDLIPMDELLLMDPSIDQENVLAYFAKNNNVDLLAEEKLYSDTLDDYLTELHGTITAGISLKASSFLCAQSLLVSIDDGCGFDNFVKRLAKEYILSGITSSLTPAAIIKEYHIANNCDKKDKYSPLQSTALAISKSAKDDAPLSRISVLDIGEWVDELDKEPVQRHLLSIQNEKKSGLIIFRIPYAERKYVQKAEKCLSVFSAIRTLVVPPLCNKKLIEYIKDKASLHNCTFEEDCDSALEQLILELKNSKRFFGFDSMDNMLNKIFFAKINHDARSGLANSPADSEGMTISREIVASLHSNPDTDLTTAEMLDRLVGIDDVKKQIEDAIRQIQSYQVMKHTLGSVKRPAIHMMFTGNPGTGKTTVARLAASMMKDAGILTKGYLNEIKGRDLCGSCIGETTPKTAGYCRDSYGSVLFIDEAYQLSYSDSPRDYGSEAIAALIAEMENHRDDMCVILAGYTDEMDKMMKTNSGLRDRIPIRINFPNYTREQLFEIFMKMVNESFSHDDDLEAHARDFFMTLPDSIINSKEFGNARFVRNLFEKSWGEASLRYDLSDCCKICITAADFDAAVVKLELDSAPKEHRFGF